MAVICVGQSITFYSYILQLTYKLQPSTSSQLTPVLTLFNFVSKEAQLFSIRPCVRGAHVHLDLPQSLPEY